MKSIGADELAEWQAYESIECGLPNTKVELYLAQIAMYIAAAFGDSKKQVKLGDFAIPRYKPDEKKMMPNQIFMELRKLGRAIKVKK